MLEAIGILSKIFFMNKLGRCKFEWIEDLVDEGFPLQGLTSISNAWVPLIEMDPNDHHVADDTDSVITSHIGTLLHEDAYDAVVGQDGHAKAWLHLATRVQRTARLVLGLEVKLGICDGIFLEFQLARFVPTGAEWARMTYIDGDELLRYLTCLEDETRDTPPQPTGEGRALKSLVISMSQRQPDSHAGSDVNVKESASTDQERRARSTSAGTAVQREQEKEVADLIGRLCL
ncbi:hypothetical protein LTR85_003491 [Meristemomyces frigidus]|nr:hypothetical protein LTR85_003491 [Meristemomyces frigidus]